MPERRADENPESLGLKGHGSREITIRSIVNLCISAYTMLADRSRGYRNGCLTMISDGSVAFIKCTKYTLLYMKAEYKKQECTE